MAWLAVDLDRKEYVYEYTPKRMINHWYVSYGECCHLPKGSIKKLIGRELTWEDEPVELKEGKS